MNTTEPTEPAPDRHEASGPVQPVIGHAASVAVPIQPPKGLSSEQRERLRVAEWNFLSRLKSTGHLSKEHPMYHAIPGPTPPQPAPDRREASRAESKESSRAAFESIYNGHALTRINISGTDYYSDPTVHRCWTEWLRALDHAAQEQRNPVLGPECPKCGTIPLNLPPEKVAEIRALFPELDAQEQPAPPQPAPEANRVVTCVYCGHEYPDGTPTAKHDLLTAHIKACEKHPMRDAEARIERLRKALSGLVGAETKKELEAMDVALRIMPGIESDKIAGLNAIHALLHEINSNSKNS